MMLGFLLARAGVDVLVLEKHADFLRDFRGDTIHPSTMEVMHELGILEDFLKRPHQELRQLQGQIGNAMVVVADFAHLPTKANFIAMMPQWDFLDFIAGRARAYPGFQLQMEAEVIDLLEETGRIVGLRAKTPKGLLEIRAELIVAADGRHSTVREKAGLEVMNFGAPIDALWMQLSRKPSDPGTTLGRVDAGRVLVMLDRGNYWQCAFVISKGTFEQIREKGLEAFREEIARLFPFMRDRVGELTNWNEIKLLTVIVDRLKRWYRAGVLCIGDAAHAMSPIGGVGINLAIQDAVAAANILAPAFERGAVTLHDLSQVQKRREWPTRMTQRLQVFMQNRALSPVLKSTKPISLPFALRLLRRWPILRRIPARLVGIGFRPEHVKTPDVTLQHSGQAETAPDKP